MGEMGKITRTVDLADLPELIRKQFVPGRPVTITVEGEMIDTFGPEAIERRKQSLLKYAGVAAHKNTTVEEAVARIRALRDESD